MKKRHIIVAIISIAVSLTLEFFLFNHPDLIKIAISNSGEVILTTAQNFVKNTAISLFCGGSIYAIFYAIPHEYNKANKKDE